METTSETKDSRGRFVHLRAVVSLCLALFILYTAYAGLFTAMVQRSTVLGGALILVFLGRPLSKKHDSTAFRLVDLILAAVSAASCGYVLMNHAEFAFRTSAPNQVDVLFGVILTVLLLEATRRTFGIAIPILTVIAILYATHGDVLPGLLGHPPISAERFTGLLYMYTEGIFGVALGTAATVVVIFLMFAALLQYLGGSKIFIQLGLALMGRFKGGPAKAAVISSSFFGMISGSIVANTAAIGPVTIPLMKKSGYSARFSAGVESAASVGGQFMPPIMGSAVFIMADLIGMPYASIAIAALIPALLYYIAIFVSIDAEASRVNVGAADIEEKAKVRDIARRGWYLATPFLLLIFLLGYNKSSPAYAAFFAIVVLLVLEILKRLIAERRLGLGEVLKSISKATESAADITVVLGCIGIVAGILGISGLSLKISALMTDISGDHLIVLLLLTMLASIVLGTALPTTPTYLLLAIVLAPAIMEFGVPALAAHLFVFYFGVLSDVTPPTAICVFVASKIAETGFFRTCFTAMRVALFGFIVPFLFVYYPALLLVGEPAEMVARIGSVLLGVIVLASVLQGYFFGRLSTLYRGLYLLVAAALFAPEFWLNVTGAAIVLGQIANHLFHRWSGRRRDNASGQVRRGVSHSELC